MLRCSSTNSGSTCHISFGGVESALSSLKTFQSCIRSGIDTVSSVALDLEEIQTEVSSECIMDKAMVEFAKDKNFDVDFKENEKFVQFEQQLGELKKQLVKLTEDGRHNEFDPNKDSSRAGNERDGIHADRENDGTEGVDEDMIVTQSQTNFICSITQLEMKKPGKNKMCGHTYKEQDVVRLIESKHKRKKKACCPKIGCSHTDMKMSDLIPDEALRRTIESHSKRKNATLSKSKPPAHRDVSSLPPCQPPESEGSNF